MSRLPFPNRLLWFVVVVVVALSLEHLPTTDAFFGALTKPSTPKTKVSPFTQEALDIFNKVYPFDREPPKPNPLNDFGMPYADLDGTILKPKPSSRKKDPKAPPRRRLTDISRERASNCFNTLVQLYGEERALTIVKVQPICLCFDSTQFGPSLEAWTEVFGLEAAQNMVARNPGLLAVKAEEASKNTDSTMAFSYIVGYTRPAGPLLLGTLLFLLLTPAIEGLTGIQFGINH